MHNELSPPLYRNCKVKYRNWFILSIEYFSTSDMLYHDSGHTENLANLLLSGRHATSGEGE